MRNVQQVCFVAFRETYVLELTSADDLVVLSVFEARNDRKHHHVTDSFGGIDDRAVTVVQMTFGGYQADATLRTASGTKRVELSMKFAGRVSYQHR